MKKTEKTMSEILKENQEKTRQRDRDRREQLRIDKRNKNIFTGVVILLVLALVVLGNVIKAQEEQHIQRVSEQCAEQGKGITPTYTKEGDKFYVCK